jgi:hypothetical protein
MRQVPCCVNRVGLAAAGVFLAVLLLAVHQVLQDSAPDTSDISRFHLSGRIRRQTGLVHWTLTHADEFLADLEVRIVILNKARPRTSPCSILNARVYVPDAVAVITPIAQCKVKYGAPSRRLFNGAWFALPDKGAAAQRRMLHAIVHQRNITFGFTGISNTAAHDNMVRLAGRGAAAAAAACSNSSMSTVRMRHCSLPGAFESVRARASESGVCVGRALR